MDFQKAAARAHTEWEEFSLDEKVERYPDDLITILLEMIENAEKEPSVIETGRLRHFRDIKVNENKKLFMGLRRWIETGPYASRWIADRAGELEEEADEDDPDDQMEARDDL